MTTVFAFFNERSRKMKRLLLVFTLSVLGLSACMGASAPGGRRCNNEGVCIKIDVVEPIRFGEPVTVTITATSEKDIANLGVSLSLDADVLVEEPQSVEKGVKDQAFWKGGTSWGIDAKANSPLTFTRKIRFPPREGLFCVDARAGIPTVSSVYDSVCIYVTREGGKIYLSGTPIPLWTPGKPIPAVTITPGPSPTRIRQTTPTRPPYP